MPNKDPTSNTRMGHPTSLPRKASRSYLLTGWSFQKTGMGQKRAIEMNVTRNLELHAVVLVGCGGFAHRARPDFYFQGNAGATTWLTVADAAEIPSRRTLRFAATRRMCAGKVTPLYGAGDGSAISSPRRTSSGPKRRPAVFFPGHLSG